MNFIFYPLIILFLASLNPVEASGAAALTDAEVNARHFVDGQIAAGALTERFFAQHSDAKELSRMYGLSLRALQDYQNMMRRRFSLAPLPVDEDEPAAAGGGDGLTDEQWAKIQDFGSLKQIRAHVVWLAEAYSLSPRAILKHINKKEEEAEAAARAFAMGGGDAEEEARPLLHSWCDRGLPPAPKSDLWSGPVTAKRPSPLVRAIQLHPYDPHIIAGSSSAFTVPRVRAVDALIPDSIKRKLATFGKRVDAIHVVFLGLNNPEETDVLFRPHAYIPGAGTHHWVFGVQVPDGPFIEGSVDANTHGSRDPRVGLVASPPGVGTVAKFNALKDRVSWSVATGPKGKTAITAHVIFSYELLRAVQVAGLYDARIPPRRFSEIVESLEKILPKDIAELLRTLGTLPPPGAEAGGGGGGGASAGGKA